MKEKVLTFIMGVLVGAIIATVGFYFYSKSNTNKHKGMRDGDRPQMSQDGNFSGRPGGGTPPEKPSDDGNGPSNGQSGTPEQKNNEQKNTDNTSENTSTETM